MNMLRRTSLRRFSFTLIFLIVFLLVLLILFVGRLIDEIIFFRYRFQKVSNPIFIIANPRSGTTFLHRLMCLDENKYNYTLMYHTIFSSISLIKLIRSVAWIDKRVGGLLHRLIGWIDSKVFGGWKDIHPTGLAQSEEDEGMYIFPMISTAICLICPFMQEFKYLTIPDELPIGVKNRLKKYYKSSIKRFMYATGKHKILLSKNVNSIGRIKTILEVFPDARIVYLVRDPRKAVPSFISMFAAPWKLHSPDLEQNGREYRALGEIAIDFFKYFQRIKPTLTEENLLVVRYEQLVENPIRIIEGIYRRFNLPLTPNFREALIEETSKARSYRSKHSYSLEQYGFTEDEIVTELRNVYEEYELIPAH